MIHDSALLIDASFLLSLIPVFMFLAIRSGDYYMFDDLDEELDLIQEQESESSQDTDEKDRDGRGITVGQVIASYFSIFRLAFFI